MSSDEVESFASMFAGAPGSSRRHAREARAQKERRTQLTDKQRSRSAVRTAQINFRCSPEFKARLDGLKVFLGKSTSIADIMEEALDLIAKDKGYEG
jgi:hypothetical protein